MRKHADGGIMKRIKRTKIIWGAGICFGILLLSGVGWLYKNSSKDTVYLREDAYVFQTAYTYVVSAKKEGDYRVKLKGKEIKEVSIKVNGIIQTEAAGSKEITLHLNKGINSLTFDDGNKIDQVVLKDSGKKNPYGAFLTYDSYEGEVCETNSKISEEGRAYREFASEASERKYVTLDCTGDYISFKLKNAANALVIRYCIPDSKDGKGLSDSINLYAGEDKKTVEVTSKYSWVYGNFPWNNDPSAKKEGAGHMFFDDTRVILDKTYPAGTEIKLQKDKENTAEYYLIDLIETEEVSAPLPMPENALNITDFGAVQGDGEDDAKAIADCIKKAAEEKKEVYIPAGVFEIGNPVFINGFVLREDGITIRGAGMWHTVLHGNASAFTIRAGNLSFYDFSLLGEVTRRRDSLDPPAFSMVTPVKGMENIHIQNIWMEHWKVGVWADVTNGINIMGCRIRNTFADGINLCGGTSNCVVTQNDIRNTGDDAIAMFNRGVLGVNNRVLYNTVSLPWLANNIALYGGKDITLRGNWLKDTICFGGGINISTNFTPQVFERTILIENNKLERCGSLENNLNANYGAIWVNTVEGYDNLANCLIKNNQITDSTYQALSFFNKGQVENMVIEKNKIHRCGTYAIETAQEAKGSVLIRDNQISDAKSGEINTNNNDNFIIKSR